MPEYRNNSDTLFIVLHEIYGINEHIAGVCRSLYDSGYDVVCPDLLDGKPAFDYAREEEAYRYFMNFVGLEPSVKKIAFLLRQEENAYKDIFLIGYSVGATIAWLCSGDPAKYGDVFQYCSSFHKLSGVICCYGSRIRDYTKLIPRCPVLLLFAEEEKSFDPYALQKELSKKEKTEVYFLSGKHGFADPYSKNYDAKSVLEAERIMRGFVERIGESITEGKGFERREENEAIAEAAKPPAEGNREI